MTTTLRKSRAMAPLALVLALGATASAAPSAKDALSLQPVQKDVDIERPQDAESDKCTIKSEGKQGWVVRDSVGQILRTFTDTNGDNVVDQWSYYKDGIEVYRDVDTNFNKKADQCRWLNTGGSRWGIDANEDGKIDFWKNISPEEVTAELVAAIRDRDRTRFERIMLGDKELKALGVGDAKAQLLHKKVEVALANFAKMAAAQAVVAEGTKWVSFGGTQPCVVPAGTEGSTADLTVYENVMAMVETEGKPLPVTVGTLVRVGDTWRLIDLPNMSENAAEPFFLAMPKPMRGTGNEMAGKPSERVTELMSELQKLGDILANNSAEEHARRAEILKQLAEESDTPENRAQWYRQLADTLNAAVQTGGYEAGIEKLKQLYEAIEAEKKDDDLAAYAQYRWMTAQHGHELAQPGSDYPKIQTKWIEDLTKFVEVHDKTPDSAEAMMELAIAQEFGGDEEQAVKWYQAIAEKFPESAVYRKAAGAKLRMTSIGKPISLKGKTINGGQAFDIERLKGKAVLIQYWATWCEPCKADMPLLKELRTKYKDFEVVGVCLDNDPQAMAAFLKQNDPRWPQLFEEGGMDGRYADELGIQTLPTMILLDKNGLVVNRNIHAGELEPELQKILK